MARAHTVMGFLGLLGLLLVAKPAQAGETPGFSFGLRGGAVLAHTDLTGKIGPGGGLLLRHGVTPRFALELSGGVGQLVTEDSQWWKNEDRYPELTPEDRLKKESYATNMGLAELRLLFTPFRGGRSGPYLYAGGGVDYFNTVDETFRRGAGTGKGSTGMVPFGLGLRLGLSRHWAMEWTAGYTLTFSDQIDELDEGRYPARFGKAGRKDNFFTATLGLVFQIPRGEAEAPVDRIAPAVPVAPPSPLSRDQDADGLTDEDEKTVFFTNPLMADSDGDGLSDGAEVHKHRTEPNHFDTDGGGIDDGQEIKRGTNPLVDSDDLAKVRARKTEEKPVPQAEPAAAPRARQALVFPVIRFEFGGSALSAQAKQGLRAAAQALDENPGFRLELRGHADNAGTPEANQRISALRAEVVKAFLVDQGIAGSRLTTRALSDRQPAAANDTIEGRRLNRRTELIPVQ